MKSFDKVKLERYRCVLEVLRYCAAGDVLLSCEAVSLLWRSATLSDELWDHFIEAAAFVPRRQGESSRGAYRCSLRNSHKLPFLDFAGVRIVDLLNCSQEVIETEWRGRLFDGYFCVVLPGSEVIVSGGLRFVGNMRGCLQPQGISSEVLLITSGAVKPLHSMLQPRTFHACVAFRDYLYAFGGCTLPEEEHLYAQAEFLVLSEVARPTDSRERLRLGSDGSWEELPKMLHTRHRFTVCVHAQSIFLCSTAEQPMSSVEVYQPDTHTSALLPVLLPTSRILFTGLIQDSLVFLCEDGLTSLHLPSGALASHAWNFYERDARQSCGHASANLVTVGQLVFQVSEDCLFRVDFASRSRTAVAIDEDFCRSESRKSLPKTQSGAGNKEQQS